MTSVWSYRDLADFRQFIRNLADRSMSMSHVLAGFREVSILPKRLGQLTVEEVTTKTELIEQIYRALKKMRPETRYKLLYVLSYSFFKRAYLFSYLLVGIFCLHE